jgi:hypothetical protein
VSSLPAIPRDLLVEKTEFAEKFAEFSSPSQMKCLRSSPPQSRGFMFWGQFRHQFHKITQMFIAMTQGRTYAKPIILYATRTMGNF